MSYAEISIPSLIRETLSAPRDAARRIIALRLDTGTMWEALALVVVLSVLAAQLTQFLAGGFDADATEILPGILHMPILLGAVQGMLMVLMVLAVHMVGRSFGGSGELGDAIALVAWLQFLMVCLQVIQALSMVILPILSALLGIVGVVGFFFLLTVFVCELHGFRRPGFVFAGIVVTMLVIIFVLSIALGFLGIDFMGDLPAGDIPNV